MSGFQEFLSCLRAAWDRMFHPEPFEDPDPQSTADATAARTAYIRGQPSRRSEEIRMRRQWEW